MERHVMQKFQGKLEAVDASQLSSIDGGIWDYSNRMGMLGQILEDRQDRPYGNVLHPKTLDAAAKQALDGWVSIG